MSNEPRTTSLVFVLCVRYSYGMETKGAKMNKGETVTVVARFHAYYGCVGTVTSTSSDEDGDIIFVLLENGREAMFDAADLEIGE